MPCATPTSPPSLSIISPRTMPLDASVACLGILPPFKGEAQEEENRISHCQAVCNGKGCGTVNGNRYVNGNGKGDFSGRKGRHGLSKRATQGPEPGPLIERFSCLFDNIYHPLNNPNGIISLGVAENLLCADEILAFSKQAIVDNLSSMDLTYGDDLWGSRGLNKALAGFFNEYFDAYEEVKPNHIITGVGVSAILDHLFHTLLDANGGVLLQKPYYTGFDRDIVGGRSGVRLIGVEAEGLLVDGEGEGEGEGCEWGGEGGLGEGFERAYLEATAQGINVRAMIITNPHNPLGQTLSRETLIGYCKFAEKHDLQLISDEIYAMSVYDNARHPNARGFSSILSLDLEAEVDVNFDKSRLHVVYGMSKDFCANGFRIGALITQHNPLLLRTLAQLSMQIKISSPSSIIFQTLLSSPYLPKFLALNQARLGEAQAFVRDWFERRGCRVGNSNAGHFVWVELGERVRMRTEGEEKKVFQRLLDGRVYIAPGSAYHHSQPGWFRITFSVARENLIEGLNRIERILELYPEE